MFTKEEKAKAQRMAEQLEAICMVADHYGFRVVIEQKPLVPPAQGNSAHFVTVTPRMRILRGEAK